MATGGMKGEPMPGFNDSYHPVSLSWWLLAVALMAAAVVVGVLLTGFTVDHLLAGHKWWGPNLAAWMWLHQPAAWMW